MADTWETIEFQSKTDGSEWLDYIRRNMDSIPDYLQTPIAHIMEMAERWIESQRVGREWSEMP